MAGKKMDDAARERLARAQAERNKTRGRNSLRGLDPEGWAASLDAVLDGTVVCPPIVHPNLDGSIPLKGITVGEFHRGTRPEPPRPESPLQSEQDAYLYALMQWREARATVSFVRIMQARSVMLEDLARAFPVRYLSIRTWHREVSAFVSDKVPVFRAADIVAVFAAIWPEAIELKKNEKSAFARKWQEMACKYLRGYSIHAAEELAWIDYAKPPTCTEHFGHSDNGP